MAVLQIMSNGDINQIFKTYVLIAPICFLFEKEHAKCTILVSKGQHRFVNAFQFRLNYIKLGYNI